MKEFINRFIRFVNRKYHECLFRVFSFCESIYAQAIGVKIGKNCEFRGWTSIFRSSYSNIKIGDNCCFNSRSYTNHIGLNHKCILCTMSEKASITIGDNCGFSSTTINSFVKVAIGNNVRIGANCTIMDGDFHLDDPRTPAPKPITIGNNVWLGANVVVMKGVTIGDNTIIGMNSLVTKPIPSNCVAAGSPCRIIKNI